MKVFTEQIDPRLDELEQFDHWLLSRTRTELCQMAWLVALTINLLNAWLLSHFPVAMDDAIDITMMVRG
jgi:hypothetical protein